MSQTIKRVELKDRTIILAGTVHISSESAEEVRSLIAAEKPGRVCVELDEGRWRSMSQGAGWESLDIGKVLKEGRGFLLMANLALSGFQRRMGAGSSSRVGEEMLAAVAAAEAEGVPYSLCDREVQVTLKRAWSRSGLWNKAKLIASLLDSAFAGEQLSPEEIEKLKEKSELDEMMSELAAYLPSVKEVLIDERDRFLASRIYREKEGLVVAVVGAGHLEGIESWLRRLDAGEAPRDTADIEAAPPPSKAGKIIGWSIPAVLVGLIAVGFFRSGSTVTFELVLRWILLNGSLAALGSALCLAHPLTIIFSFVSAPIASLNPFVGVGLFAGLAEAFLRKPRVSDLENLAQDASSVKGFYRNRVTKILLIFFLSSLGGMIGNFIALPFLASGALK
jgi:pheromone shutdown-related protein TraB